MVKRAPQYFSKIFQNFFAFTEAIEHGSERAYIQRVRSQPNEVRRDTLQFRKNCADHTRGRGGASTPINFSDRFAVAQSIGDGRHVIHAVNIGSELLIGAVLGDLFDAARCKYPMMHSEPTTFSPSSFNFTRAKRRAWKDAAGRHINNDFVRASEQSSQRRRCDPAGVVISWLPFCKKIRH